MRIAKKQFRCGQCGKKVNTTIAERVEARLCTICALDLDAFPAMRSKPAKGSRKAELAGVRDQRAVFGPAPRIRRNPDAPRRFTLLDAARVDEEGEEHYAPPVAL